MGLAVASTGAVVGASTGAVVGATSGLVVVACGVVVTATGWQATSISTKISRRLSLAMVFIDVFLVIVFDQSWQLVKVGNF